MFTGYEKCTCMQRAKKVVSDSPGLVDFAIGLVNSVFNLLVGQVKNRRTVKSILLVKKLKKNDFWANKC